MMMTYSQMENDCYSHCINILSLHASTEGSDKISTSLCVVRMLTMTSCSSWSDDLALAMTKILFNESSIGRHVTDDVKGRPW